VSIILCKKWIEQKLLSQHLLTGWLLAVVDKSSSAELTESINSMFQWYRKAVVCYVLLEDLNKDAALDVALEDGLSRCRWFTRGWTLQELLAPKQVEIFNEAWVHVGTKSDRAKAISKLTRLPTDVLLNETDILRVSIAERMSWASSRQTKRKEDLAYCLLGIFDVNMPLIYGEGEKAFRRLQEEIIKRSNDLTILVWDPALGSSANVPRYVGILAKSPVQFANSGDVTLGRFDHLEPEPEFSLTNRGLFLKDGFVLVSSSCRIDGNPPSRQYMLRARKYESDVGIFLRKLGPNSYCRLGRIPFTSTRLIDNTTNEDQEMVYIMTDVDHYRNIDDALELSRMYGIYVPEQNRLPEQSRMDMISAVPLLYWDHIDSCFLTAPSRITDFPMVLAVEFSLWAYGYREEIVVIIRDDEHEHKLYVFRSSDAVRDRDLLFRGRTRIEGISWEDLLMKSPQLDRMKDSIELYMVKDTLLVHFFLQGIDHPAGFTIIPPEHEPKPESVASTRLKYLVTSIGSQRSNASG
jgi:hypothetical protein